MRAISPSNVAATRKIAAVCATFLSSMHEAIVELPKKHAPFMNIPFSDRISGTRGTKRAKLIC
jgi:hypothetical protein